MTKMLPKFRVSRLYPDLASRECSINPAVVEGWGSKIDHGGFRNNSKAKLTIDDRGAGF